MDPPQTLDLQNWSLTIRYSILAYAEHSFFEREGILSLLQQDEFVWVNTKENNDKSVMVAGTQTCFTQLDFMCDLKASFIAITPRSTLAWSGNTW